MISTPEHPTTHSETALRGAAGGESVWVLDTQEHGDVWQESVCFVGVHGGGPCVHNPT